MKSMSRKAEIAVAVAGPRPSAPPCSWAAAAWTSRASPSSAGPRSWASRLKITASPDVLTADGFSTSLIQVQVFDQNGQPVAGRTVLLAIANAGGKLRRPRARSTHPRAASCAPRRPPWSPNASGVATAIYTAPAAHRLHRERIGHRRGATGGDRCQWVLYRSSHRAEVGRAQALPAGTERHRPATSWWRRRSAPTTCSATVRSMSNTCRHVPGPRALPMPTATSCATTGTGATAAPTRTARRRTTSSSTAAPSRSPTA